MQWILTYPVWTLIIVAILATLLTYWLYKGAKAKFEVSLIWVLFLSALRWTAIFLIGLLLLNPLVKSITNDKIDAKIIFLEDNSASVRWGIGEQKLKDYQDKVSSLIDQLSEKFQVKSYFFGVGIADSLADSNRFHLQGTDIDKAIEQIAQRINNQNIGAVIISSDGLFNQGLNPIYNKSLEGIPVYTILVGDTTTYKDVRIQRLKYNDVVYLGDEAQILVEVGANNLNGQNIEVQLKDTEGKVLETKRTQISSDDWYQTIEFKILAEHPSIQKYHVHISKLSQEKTFSNNQQEFYIQVIDGRQKVAIIYDAPHPDIRFIREALSELKNIDINVLHVNDFINSKKDLDLLILYGLPSIKNSSLTTQLQSVIQDIHSKWWIVNQQTDFNAFNKLQSVAQLSQIQPNPIEVNPIYLPTYQNFFVSEQAIQWLDKVPPLIAPYGQYQLSPSVEVCWMQKMNKVKLQVPLLVTSSQNTQKTAILFGEGMWRWKMQAYLETQNTSDVFEWVQRLVQYIASKKDHRQFKIKSDKTIYNESERVTLEATLHNESGQLINTSDVKVLLKKDNTAYSDFFMDKSPNAFTYHLGKLPSGSYNVLASTELNGKKVDSEYKFAVQSFNIESSRTKADFQLMNSLAVQHFGKMYYWKDMHQLMNDIQNDERIRPIFKENMSTKALIDYKIVLGIIILLLSIEWFLRRFFDQP